MEFVIVQQKASTIRTARITVSWFKASFLTTEMRLFPSNVFRENEKSGVYAPIININGIPKQLIEHQDQQSC